MAWIRHYGRWYDNPPMQSRGWITHPDGGRSYDPGALTPEWNWFPGWVSNLWKFAEHREGFVLPALVTVLAVLVCVARCRSRAFSGSLLL